MSPDINSLPPSCSASSSPSQSHTTTMASGTGSGTASRSGGGSGPGPFSSEASLPVSPARRPSSSSLAAAATINAADISRRSSIRASPQAGRVHERRRSAVPMNLTINDPTIPGPGEFSSSDRERRLSIPSAYRTGSPTTSSIAGSPVFAMRGDPHHNRTPSLGELHQELEQEQEAQVVCFLSVLSLELCADISLLEPASHVYPPATSPAPAITAAATVRKRKRNGH